jgi:hypothetical protein
MSNKLLLGVVVVLIGGCGGPERYLRWNSRPSAPAVTGNLAIEVMDRREPEKGGNDTRAIGLGTGAFGIPDTIRLASPTEVAESVHDYLAQAALAGGIAVAAPGGAPPSAKAMVVIQTMWCTGYAFVFKADVTLNITFVDPATNQVRMNTAPFHTDDGDSDCRGAYMKALSKGFDAALVMFNNPQVKGAVVGQAAPPQMPPPQMPPPQQ